MSYNFEDWRTGKITIEGTYHSIQNGSSTKLIFWNDLDEIEQDKIRAEQNLIFSKLCQAEFELIVKDFSQRFEKSHFKQILIDKEIKKLNELLFSYESSNSINSKYSWGNIRPFNAGEDSFLKGIRDYFSKCYIDGFTVIFDFVNSLDSPFNLNFEEYDHMPEVQGEVLYRFYNYLNELTAEKQIIFDNKYWNATTFNLFKYLSNNYIKTNTIGKYNLIFHFLKQINSKEYLIYHFSMKKMEYYEFITKNINADFISLKGTMPSMNPPETDEKDTAFNLLNMFKNDFESI